MASLSPNAVLVESAMNADGINGMFTYDVTVPDGRLFRTTYGTFPQAHADNLASMLADGGYLAAKAAEHLQADGFLA